MAPEIAGIEVQLMGTKMKTVLVVVALLVGIGAFNYIIKMDPTQLAARGVGKDPHSHDKDHEDEEKPGTTREDLMRPIGPEGAAVTITVLWSDQVELEGIIRPMLTEVAGSYKDNVRVEFLDPASDEYKKVVTEVTNGAPVGLLINGEMIKEVPEAPLGMLAFSGSPSFEEWGQGEVHLAVEHELDTAGVEFEPHAEHDHSLAPGHIESSPSHEGHDH